MNGEVLKLFTKRRNKEIAMNPVTKTVHYTNGYKAEILPYGKKLNGEAAAKVRKVKNIDIQIGAGMSLEAMTELSFQSAKIALVKLYAPNSSEPIAQERVDEILRERDKFSEWIVTEASKFQQELDDEWGAEAKN